jgi:PAT family beta-lactamase induction signal transducer AmpG
VGASLKVMGYRIALILTGGLALVLADRIPFTTVYLLMALAMLIGVAGAFLAPEPVLREAPPATLASAVVKPWLDFTRRTGPTLAVLVLLFIVLYSLSDRLVQNLANPFLLASGYTLTEVGAITQALGLAATIVGVVVGGVFVARLGINRALWILAFIQMGSNLAYYLLAVRPKSISLLTGAILVENFSGGLVTAGFVAFLMAMCSRQFSATQYALLSSFMAFARDFVAGFGGDVAEVTGWPRYFLFTIAAGIPALLLLPVIAPWTRENPRGAAAHTGETTDDPRGDATRPLPES